MLDLVDKNQEKQNTTEMVSEARDLSFQARASGDTNNWGLLWWLARAGLNVSPWWTPARDKDLRSFWKSTDYLSGAIYALQAKMTAIPFTVIPKDQSNRTWVKQAEDFTERLLSAAEYGEGWAAFYGKWVEDLLCQDNGSFAEVIGEGDPTGALIGAPVSVAHMDSSRCQRTGNPLFPVLYRDMDGKQYKLHYSRVIYTAQMPSPIVDMFGVGFCATSRCLNVAQSLLDILVYKQEKLGSRPHRSILVSKGGLDPSDITSAFQMAETELDSQNLTRYGKSVVVGSSTIPEAGIDVIELASMPEGFNEETSITFGMATIALAFGVDARELFPAMSAGATRADALLQHLKQRGKGPGQIIQVTESQFNFKFLPPHLKMVFDFQDDAQDRQVADIKAIRANYRNVDLQTRSVNIRVSREQMLESGDLTRSQFERLELEDGRLSDGTEVVALFYSNDAEVQKYLKLEGVSDPLDVLRNDPLKIIQKANKKLNAVRAEIINSNRDTDKLFFARIIAALSRLIVMYTPPPMEESNGKKLEKPYSDPRVRNTDLVTPNMSTETSTETQSHDGGDTEEPNDEEDRD